MADTEKKSLKDNSAKGSSIKTDASYPVYFILLYATTYMANAVYNTFIPVYLKSLSLTGTIIGALLSLGPLVAVLSQPFWGITGDRAKSKNDVLKILVAGSAVAIVVFPLSTNVFFLFAVITVFTFFQSSVNPLSDAITLEQLEGSRFRFGRIRLAGTLGFAAMSVLAGTIINKKSSNMFILYFAITLLVFFTVTRLPIVKGHQSDGQRMQIWELFRNRELMLLISLNFIIQATLGYYYSFFPIYFNQSGGNSTLLGIAMLISSTSEIPFLLNADKILTRFGIKATLIFSALVVTLRWLLMYMVSGAGAMLAVNALHGMTFIIFSYCMATYINNNVPRELRASGQTLNALLCMGLARIIGSFFGGMLSDLTSIRQVFLYVALIDLAAAAVYCVIFLKQKSKLTGPVDQ